MQVATTINNPDGVIVKRVSVPVGLEEIMEGLTKEVLRKKPKDLYKFAHEYFSHLLVLRQEKEVKERIHTVQSAIRVEGVKPIPSERVTPRRQPRQISVRSNNISPKTVKKDLIRQLSQNRSSNTTNSKYQTKNRDLSIDLKRQDSSNRPKISGISSNQSTPRDTNITETPTVRKRSISKEGPKSKISDKSSLPKNNNGKNKTGIKKVNTNQNPVVKNDKVTTIVASEPRLDFKDKNSKENLDEIVVKEKNNTDLKKEIENPLKEGDLNDFSSNVIDIKSDIVSDDKDVIDKTSLENLEKSNDSSSENGTKTQTTVETCVEKTTFMPIIYRHHSENQNSAGQIQICNLKNNPSHEAADKNNIFNQNGGLVDDNKILSYVKEYVGKSETTKVNSIDVKYKTGKNMKNDSENETATFSKNFQENKLKNQDPVVSLQNYVGQSSVTRLKSCDEDNINTKAVSKLQNDDVIKPLSEQSIFEIKILDSEAFEKNENPAYQNGFKSDGSNLVTNKIDQKNTSDTCEKQLVKEHISKNYVGSVKSGPDIPEHHEKIKNNDIFNKPNSTYDKEKIKKANPSLETMKTAETSLENFKIVEANLRDLTGSKTDITDSLEKTDKLVNGIKQEISIPNLSINNIVHNAAKNIAEIGKDLIEAQSKKTNPLNAQKNTEGSSILLEDRMSPDKSLISAEIVEYADSSNDIIKIKQSLTNEDTLENIVTGSKNIITYSLEKNDKLINYSNQEVERNAEDFLKVQSKKTNKKSLNGEEILENLNLLSVNKNPPMSKTVKNTESVNSFNGSIKPIQEKETDINKIIGSVVNDSTDLITGSLDNIGKLANNVKLKQENIKDNLLKVDSYLNEDKDSNIFSEKIINNSSLINDETEKDIVVNDVLPKTNSKNLSKFSSITEPQGDTCERLANANSNIAIAEDNGSMSDKNVKVFYENQAIPIINNSFKTDILKFIYNEKINVFSKSNFNNIKKSCDKHSNISNITKDSAFENQTSVYKSVSPEAQNHCKFSEYKIEEPVTENESSLSKTTSNNAEYADHQPLIPYIAKDAIRQFISSEQLNVFRKVVHEQSIVRKKCYIVGENNQDNYKSELEVKANHKKVGSDISENTSEVNSNLYTEESKSIIHTRADKTEQNENVIHTHKPKGASEITNVENNFDSLVVNEQENVTKSDKLCHIPSAVEHELDVSEKFLASERQNVGEIINKCENETNNNINLTGNKSNDTDTFLVQKKQISSPDVSDGICTPLINCKELKENKSQISSDKDSTKTSILPEEQNTLADYVKSVKEESKGDKEKEVENTKSTQAEQHAVIETVKNEEGYGFQQYKINENESNEQNINENINETPVNNNIFITEIALIKQMPDDGIIEQNSTADKDIEEGSLLWKKNNGANTNSTYFNMKNEESIKKIQAFWRRYKTRNYTEKANEKILNSCKDPEEKTQTYLDVSDAVINGIIKIQAKVRGFIERKRLKLYQREIAAEKIYDVGKKDNKTATYQAVSGEKGNIQVPNKINLVQTINTDEEQTISTLNNDKIETMSKFDPQTSEYNSSVTDNTSYEKNNEKTGIVSELEKDDNNNCENESDIKSQIKSAIENISCTLQNMEKIKNEIITSKEFLDLKNQNIFQCSKDTNQTEKAVELSVNDITDNIQHIKSVDKHALRNQDSFAKNNVTFQETHNTNVIKPINVKAEKARLDALKGHVDLIDQVQNKILDQIAGKTTDTTSKFDIDQLRKELEEAAMLYKDIDEFSEIPFPMDHNDELLQYLSAFDIKSTEKFDLMVRKPRHLALPDIKEEEPESKPDLVSESINVRKSLVIGSNIKKTEKSHATLSQSNNKNYFSELDDNAKASETPENHLTTIKDNCSELQSTQNPIHIEIKPKSTPPEKVILEIQTLESLQNKELESDNKEYLVSAPADLKFRDDTNSKNTNQPNNVDQESLGGHSTKIIFGDSLTNSKHPKGLDKVNVEFASKISKQTSDNDYAKHKSLDCIFDDVNLLKTEDLIDKSVKSSTNKERYDCLVLDTEIKQSTKLGDGLKEIDNINNKDAKCEHLSVTINSEKLNGLRECDTQSIRCLDNKENNIHDIEHIVPETHNINMTEQDSSIKNNKIKMSENHDLSEIAQKDIALETDSKLADKNSLPNQDNKDPFLLQKQSTVVERKPDLTKIPKVMARIISGSPRKVDNCTPRSTRSISKSKRSFSFDSKIPKKYSFTRKSSAGSLTSSEKNNKIIGKILDKNSSSFEGQQLATRLSGKGSDINSAKIDKQKVIKETFKSKEIYDSELKYQHLGNNESQETSKKPNQFIESLSIEKCDDQRQKEKVTNENETALPVYEKEDRENEIKNIQNENYYISIKEINEKENVHNVKELQRQPTVLLADKFPQVLKTSAEQNLEKLCQLPNTEEENVFKTNNNSRDDTFRSDINAKNKLVSNTVNTDKILFTPCSINKKLNTNSKAEKEFFNESLELKKPTKKSNATIGEELQGSLEEKSLDKTISAIGSLHNSLELNNVGNKDNESLKGSSDIISESHSQKPPNTTKLSDTLLPKSEDKMLLSDGNNKNILLGKIEHFENLPINEKNFDIRTPVSLEENSTDSLASVVESIKNKDFQGDNHHISEIEEENKDIPQRKSVNIIETKPLNTSGSNNIKAPSHLTKNNISQDFPVATNLIDMPEHNKILEERSCRSENFVPNVEEGNTESTVKLENNTNTQIRDTCKPSETSLYIAEAQALENNGNGNPEIDLKPGETSVDTHSKDRKLTRASKSLDSTLTSNGSPASREAPAGDASMTSSSIEANQRDADACVTTTSACAQLKPDLNAAEWRAELSAPENSENTYYTVDRQRPKNMASGENTNTEKKNNNILDHISSNEPPKKMETQAATKIQAGFRGYQVRRQLKLKHESDKKQPKKNSPKGKPEELEEKSAVKIQAGVRGFLVRRRQKKHTNSSASP